MKIWEKKKTGTWGHHDGDGGEICKKKKKKSLGVTLSEVRSPLLGKTAVWTHNPPQQGVKPAARERVGWNRGGLAGKEGLSFFWKVFPCWNTERSNHRMISTFVENRGQKGKAAWGGNAAIKASNTVAKWRSAGRRPSGTTHSH